jgi:hypothetical protein
MMGINGADMSKDGKLHAAGDLEKRARAYWATTSMAAHPITDILVKGDGGVNIVFTDDKGRSEYYFGPSVLYPNHT